jgi:hypothetical protein
MRVVSLGLMIAFLVTALHVVVDHGASGEGHGVFFSHACPPHLDDDDQATDMHHQHDDEDEHASEPHAGHHHADTHSHFTWYTSAGAPDARRPMALVYDTHVWVADNPVTPPAFLLHVTTCAPLAQHVCLPLWCRVLLI